MRARLRCWLIVLAAFVGAAVPCRADEPPEKDVEAYLQIFYEAALWNDGRWPINIRKWNRPLRVKIAGSMPGSYADLVVTRLRDMTGLAGLDMKVLASGEPDENFLVQFIETTQLYASGRAAGCVTQPKYADDGSLSYVTLLINLNVNFELRACIAHELMHAMGFMGHPHQSDSVLSYIYKRDNLTPLDKMALRILYDPKLKLRVYQLPAMVEARDVLVDKLIADGASAETRELGRTFIKNLPALTTRLANDGNGGLQYQLGMAYTFGYIVEKDEKAGFAWFQRAAQNTKPDWQGWATDAMFMLGYGYDAGRGVDPNLVEAVRWYREAAARGNIAAQNNLGWAYQKGRGVAADPVEAYKWYALAADKKNKMAETNLANLIVNLTAEQIEIGRQRKAQWKPPGN